MAQITYEDFMNVELRVAVVKAAEEIPKSSKLVKLTVGSLILGSALAHFGVTPEKILSAFGLSPEQAMELARQVVAWAMPNLTLGALILVPVWLVVYLFRPPRPRIDTRL